MQRLFCYISLIFLLFSCGESIDYKGKNLSNGWSYDDSITQAVDMQDGEQLDLIINHSDQYPYQNLYLTIEAQAIGETIYQDTLSIALADESGYWLGDCSANICSYRYPLPQVLLIDEIQVAQYSRDSLLMGVQSIDIDLRSLSQ